MSIQRNFLSLILSFKITFFCTRNFWPIKVGATVVMNVPIVEDGCSAQIWSLTFVIPIITPYNGMAGVPILAESPTTVS